MIAKRIILFLDGTWNDVDVGPTDTNIIRMQHLISNSLDPSSALLPAAATALTQAPAQKIAVGRTYAGETEHIVYYERGVGTGAFDRFRGGAFGTGLAGNVRRAYKFLSFWYEGGDQIFIFGFSRGAYTARSLVGYVAAAGLLSRDNCTPELEAIAWAFYRTPPNDRLPGVWSRLTPFTHDRDRFEIDCVGVFDTVGALGVPLAPFWRANRDQYGFHDVSLSSITKVNLHAIAIDEHREPFQATIWRKPKFKHFASRTEQVWFAGAHADVGGSYIDEQRREIDFPFALDDIPLDWMLKRVLAHFPDFPFRPEKWKRVDTRWSAATQHEPRKLYHRLFPWSWRSIANYAVDVNKWFYEGNVCHDRHADPIGEMIHISALERLGQDVWTDDKSRRPYAPKNLVAVLSRIKSTYRPSTEKTAMGPDIRVVDWTGADLDPNDVAAQKVIEGVMAEAIKRLALA